MLIHDSAAATSRTLTPEGFLRVRARIARSGVHLYRAGELGVPDGFAPDGDVRVYRPPDQVFEPDAMASFAGKPVTDRHPPLMVDARNWKRYAIGHSGPEVTREGDHLAADLLITDADAVARAEGGAQLSNGYYADFDFAPGLTPEGEPYDAVQSNIRGNHIALVDAGRCGESCRIGDVATADCGCDGASAMTAVTIEGITVETTAAGAEALGRLRLAIEARDGANAALTAKLLDDTGLEARVRERMAVVDAARTLFGSSYDATALSTADLRRAVVASLLGTGVEARGDAYVQAAFETLLATRRGSNPLASHLAAAQLTTASRDAARHARDHFLNRAWKGEQPHGAL